MASFADQKPNAVSTEALEERSIIETNDKCQEKACPCEDPKPRRRPRRIIRRAAKNRIPAEITENKELQRAVSQLPANYNFEIYKTVWRIKEAKASTVALQFPEGLLMYACAISDMLERFTGCTCMILGDVTYGACCIDDLTARAAGCDFLVHYGHSCLVPIGVTTIKCLYIFVEILIDVDHMVDCIKCTFAVDTKLAVLGTIQFSTSIHLAGEKLKETYSNVTIPQAMPLSPGETLGCTSPVLGDVDAFVFVADGRFHLEAAMIHNPAVQAYRYDPYPKLLTKEGYDTAKMQSIRHAAIERARCASRFGLILGTLGRQGNPSILAHLKELLRAQNKDFFVLLLSEIFPAKLAMFNDVDAWIQVACPRLSIDWGHFFDKPVLNPYEAEVALRAEAWRDVYPMDYYAKGSGPWTNMFEKRTS